VLILFIHPHFTHPGGAGKFVLEIADRLSKKGLNVGILTLAVDDTIIDPYKHIRFHCIGGPLPNSFAHWLSFASLAKQIDRTITDLGAEILVPGTFPANYWGFLYKRSHKEVPCIWYCQEPSAFVHNLGFILGLKGAIKYAALVSNPLFQWLDRKLVGYADKILVNSYYTAGMVEKIYHRSATVVYPGVDATKYKPTQQKEEFIFTIGRLTKFKKVNLIIRALALLRQEGTQMRLIVGGDGEDKPNLMNLARKSALSEQVEFIGRLSDEDVCTYMSRAKFVVFPTTNEPFGLVPLEAMACGTPVIVSDTGGPKETVIDGETGLTFKADNQADLAHKIRFLWGNENLLAKMSSAARKHVEEKFSWDVTANTLYKLFVP
jgi:glycosyltransferase involved in cell wall biosynthesis